ncbi:uncharacterized protein BO72DRAFT_497102 [Aspergillus fijiensis CBS 313.89]|uniref:Uncharacterized protein n=1 Tax=Aspergillus fijiensis CBS 313.89 TaxID=1448319 RepID=A0A8G1W0S2_9EURO|nr:uncharacterized protein BO72DRAFT_497102 [Aspergillus fijiensis CBS 313.89]RAK76324.1 hypothetical protein BO72DRAFT_497102 [Aspergillus fijiensis CBS 313.89]
MKVYIKLMLSFAVLNLLSTLVTAGPEKWMPRARYKRHSIFPRQSSTPTGVNPTDSSFFIGQVDYGTDVSLQISGSNLIVNYPVTKDFIYTDVHVWIGTGTAPGNPGGYPYTLGNGACTLNGGATSATCTIPISGITTKCDTTTKYNIVTHASVKSPTLGDQTGTAGQDTFQNNWWNHNNYYKASCDNNNYHQAASHNNHHH